MSYNNRFLMTALFGLFLTACASKPETTDTTTTTTKADTSTSSTGTSRPTTGNVVSSGVSNAFGTRFSAEQLRNMGIEGDPLNYKTVFFQYNSSAIDRRSDVIVRAHARHLRGRSDVRVRLEGHADERGTRDFNLALGERRSQSVLNLLKAEGSSAPANTISYGEERPVNTAHNEAAWTQNRRVDIVY